MPQNLAAFIAIATKDLLSLFNPSMADPVGMMMGTSVSNIGCGVQSGCIETFMPPRKVLMRPGIGIPVGCDSISIEESLFLASKSILDDLIRKFIVGRGIEKVHLAVTATG